MAKNENYFNDLTYYCNSIKNSKPLTREQEKDLSIRIKNGDEEALNELVNSNLKYVITIAKRFAWSGIPMYDLVSEGNLGLIRAAKKFDYNRGTKFITCARPWITQAIQEFVKSQNVDKEFSSIDDYVFDNEVSDEMINTEFEHEVDILQSRSNAINELLKSLNKREYRVLQSYFGLNGEKEQTLEEISQSLGISKERVRQIKDNCIEKIQYKVMSNKKYSEFKELY